MLDAGLTDQVVDIKLRRYEITRSETPAVARAPVVTTDVAAVVFKVVSLELGV